MGPFENLKNVDICKIIFKFKHITAKNSQNSWHLMIFVSIAYPYLKYQSLLLIKHKLIAAAFLMFVI